MVRPLHSGYSDVQERSVEVVGSAFLVALAIWLFAIWRSHNERGKHLPPEGRDKTSSDPSVF